MTFLFVVVGALLGAFVCAGVFQQSLALSAMLFGALFGLVLGQLARLRGRVTTLERALAERTAAAQGPLHAPPSAAAAVPLPAATPRAPAMPSSPVFVPEAPAAVRESAPVGGGAPAALSTPTPALPAVETAAAPPAPHVVRVPSPRPVAPRDPDLFARGLAWLRNWFSEGNVPVKVGILVFFLGVAALLKYLVDEHLLRAPIWLRLTALAALALGALAFGWFKRVSHRTFALSLQGGAIGVLMLDVFAAFRLYALLGAAPAFALLVAVVVAGGALALLQDALGLALLAIVGGFLAPILIDTGSGNHVALFGYYAVLNAGIFVLAWLKPWRALNLLGFGFTFAIGTIWGVLKYEPTQFASTEPFLLLFFAFYLCIPAFYARRLEPERRMLIDGTLVFGTPLIAFALQASLLWPDKLPLAYSALVAAVVYAAFAFAEWRAAGMRLLAESHALLALGFGTVAVPLALSARTTSSTWALEGAALIWLGLRQGRRLPRWIGYALQIAAALAFADAYSRADDQHVLANGTFVGALLLAAAALVGARLLARAAGDVPASIALFVWGWAWWWVGAGLEIDRFGAAGQQADWWLALVAVSGAAGAAAFMRWRWTPAAWPALAQIGLAPLLLIATAHYTPSVPFAQLPENFDHGVLEGAGGAAWALWLACALYALFALCRGAQALAPLAHLVLRWTVALVLAVELDHVCSVHLDAAMIWCALAAFAPLAVLFAAVLQRWPLATWPDGAVAERVRQPLLVSLGVVLGLGWFAGLFAAGEPTPLPYLPLLNPLELAQLGFLALLWLWYRHSAAEGGALLDAELRARLLAGAGVVLLTAITLRATHFIGGVAWGPELWDSALAQAALSIVWTLAGIAAMLLGKQRSSRAVWIGGGVLMGVVILKLLLLDRQHLHDLAAIVGVLIVGALLVAVGYFAPVPPRRAGDAAPP